MRLRVTIRSLLALVFLVAFTLAAFRGANIEWAAASILAALIVLCSATLNALVRRDPSRPVWVGFALFGWAYFLLHFGPWASWKTGYVPARFTTWAVASMVLPRVDPELDGSEFAGQMVNGVEEFIMVAGRGAACFCAVFHSLASVLFGLLGGMVGMTVRGRVSLEAGSDTGTSSTTAVSGTRRHET